MDNEQYKRQLDICHPKLLKKLRIDVIGVGSLGSAIAIILAKMGCSLRLMDHDVISEHNVSNQLCLNQIGQMKVKSLGSLIEMMTGKVVTTVGKRWKPGAAKLGNIVIPAVDDIDLRKEIWEDCKAQNVDFVIDPRMGGEIGAIYIATSDRRGRECYEESAFFEKEDAEDLPCTARSIMYCPIAVAAFVASIVKEIATTGTVKDRWIHLDMKNRVLLR